MSRLRELNKGAMMLTLQCTIGIAHGLHLTLTDLNIDGSKFQMDSI